MFHSQALIAREFNERKEMTTFKGSDTLEARGLP